MDALARSCSTWRTMHDSGIGYHCGTEGLSMSPVSAPLGHAGHSNIGKYFEHRS